MSKIRVAAAVIAASIFVLAGTFLAQGASNHSLSWLISVAGVGLSRSNTYLLLSSPGQSVVGSSSSSQYAIEPDVGAFVTATPYREYVPLIQLGQ